MYVALLRGINVNGHRMIRMADLRSLASGLGFEDVETYIQTGNVLLRSDGTEETVRSALEEALRGWFGEEVPVAVRTPEQLRDVAATCPFAPQRDTVVMSGSSSGRPIRRAPQSSRSACRAPATRCSSANGTSTFTTGRECTARRSRTPSSSVPWESTSPRATCARCRRSPRLQGGCRRPLIRTAGDSRA